MRKKKTLAIGQKASRHAYASNVLSNPCKLVGRAIPSQVDHFLETRDNITNTYTPFSISYATACYMLLRNCAFVPSFVGECFELVESGWMEIAKAT